MILPKINPDRVLDLVGNGPLIAFQQLEYGWAVAATGEAYYSPVGHPAGGNLPNDFQAMLGRACVRRLSWPALRTLRPTAKPIPSAALVAYLRTFGDTPEPMANYDKAAGDHAAVIESECQVVIQAIEEHERPDLKDAMRPAKREALSDALDLVIQNAESARELCEVGEDKPHLVKMYLLQSSTAMKSALEMLLQP